MPAIHAQLSESSVSEYTHAHDGKGREWNRKGSGGETRVETSHHVVTYVSAGHRDAMMSEANR